MRLEKKSVIVTGAARGIGNATARRMAEEGGSIVAVDIDEEGVMRTATELRDAGFVASGVVADVSTANGNREIVHKAVKLYGGVDVFHANAAIAHFAEVVETEEADWDRVHAVNLKGVFLGVRAAIPHMRHRRGGSIIFTSSVLGDVGDAGLPAYGAAKGGLRALCRSIAVGYGSDNIRCNTICPGDVETRLVIDFLAKQDDPQAARKQLIDEYPLGRLASPEDVANVAVFLASEEAGYLTGTDIVVDGGLLATCY